MPYFQPDDRNARRVSAVNSTTSENLSQEQDNLTTAEFITELSRLDVKLWLDGERLHCNAPKGVLTPILKTQISDRKAEILDFLGDKSDDGKISALLHADAVLDASIQPELSSDPTVNPNRILLTGATGFVGAFLLHELLKQTSADIYCLVRAESIELARTKLHDCLKSYLLWSADFQSRIIPVLGDLSKKLLGLAESQFRELTINIDAIYHNGAWVHHALPYSALKNTNVIGTQEVLRLACQTKVKPVHFISATSVFSETEESGESIIRERDSIDNQRVPSGGYSQSKWVAEKLVKAADDRGLPINIYRLGRISGHSQTGVFNANDFLYRLIIGCVELGSIPDVEMMQDIVPIDYAVSAIIHLSQQSKWGKAFHLSHPQPVSTNLFFAKLRSLGYPLPQIPYHQWHQQLLNIAANNPKHALYPLVALLPSAKTNAPTPESEATAVKFDCQNTLDGLSDTSIICPAINDRLLDIYFAYLIEHGFVPPPPIPEPPQIRQKFLTST
jgi:thioester reductase-like protein